MPICVILEEVPGVTKMSKTVSAPQESHLIRKTEVEANNDKAMWKHSNRGSAQDVVIGTLPRSTSPEGEEGRPSKLSAIISVKS